MLTLTTHNPDRPAPANSFFILNKGMNSGRPSDLPYRNCFMASCSSPEERNFYYWLCYGLWKCKQFEQLLCGSVIPFIRIDDLKKEIARQSVILDNAAYMATLSQLMQLEQKENILRQQLALFAKLKVAMIRQHLRP